MGKALKSIVVLNLVLSGVVIYFGAESFSERKILKAEALELEKTIGALAGRLQWGAQVPWENEGEAKPVGFRFSQPTEATALNDLKSELDPLARFATQRQAQLKQRNTELVQTRRTLADTQGTLADRERELEEERSKENRLTAELAETNAELANARSTATTLESEKSTRESDIRTKNNNLTELNNTVASLEIDLETRIQELENLKAEYERCRIGVEGERSTPGEVRGKKGLVLAVNQDWEYVVIDKGNLKLEPNLEAFVHRGKDYVGKLNVLRVEESLAVAVIVPGSIVEGESIKPGDTLFF